MNEDLEKKTNRLERRISSEQSRMIALLFLAIVCAFVYLWMKTSYENNFLNTLN